MKVDITKNYRTYGGSEVRIYSLSGTGAYCVHGAIKKEDGLWDAHTWCIDGRWNMLKPGHSFNLVEVRPRIRREGWVNIHEDDAYDIYKTKELADSCAASDRLACIKITIDCEEGEGLED